MIRTYAGFGTRLLLLVTIVGTIGCDRITKHLAEARLGGMPRQSFVADTVRLEYVENTGAFLSLGADWPPRVRTAVFTAGNALLLLWMGVQAARRQWPAWAVSGAALFMAGGASNLFDRLTRGTVIDFMNVGLGSVRTGIFNVADMAILLGAILVLVESYRRADST